MSDQMRYWFQGLPIESPISDSSERIWFQGLPVQFAPPIQIATVGLYVDTDVFYSPDASNVGGGGSDLLPSLLAADDAVYQPTATPGPVDLVPSIVASDDALHQPTAASISSLGLSAIAEDDSFHQPTVASSDDLLPDVVAEGDIFYDPSVEAHGALSPSLLVDADAFHQPSVVPGEIDLSPSAYDPADSFFSPSASATYSLLPSLLDDATTFHQPAAANTARLLPSRIVDADSVHAASVSSVYSLLPTSVNLPDVVYVPVDASIYNAFAPLLVDADAFYDPAITTTGVGITPLRYADADVIYTATVQRQKTNGNGGGGTGGTVTSDLKYATKITMTESGLITALQMISSAARTVNTRMMIYADSAGLPGALLGQSNPKSALALGTNTYTLLVPVSTLSGQSVWVALHTDGNVNWFLSNSPGGSRYNTDLFADGPSDPFGVASVDNKKAPVLLVFLESANASVSPPLHQDVDSFFTPSLGRVNLLPPTLVDDSDFFYAAVSTGVVPLSPSAVADQDAAHSPSVSVGSVTLGPPFVDSDESTIIPVIGVGDGNVFPPPPSPDDDFGETTVTAEGADLPPSLVDDGDLFYVPDILGVFTLAPDLSVDSDDHPNSSAQPGDVVERPAAVVDVDQFWFAALVAGPGTDAVLPDALDSDDAFYVPAAGSPRRAHRVTLRGSGAARPVVGASASNERTLSGLSTAQVAIDGAASGGNVTIEGDASGAAQQLEGSDA